MRFAALAISLFCFQINNAATLIDVALVTDKILMLTFSDGEVDHYDLGENVGNGIVSNAPLNISQATNVTSFAISSPDDVNYQTAQQPVNVYRKSKLGDIYANWSNPETVLEHSIYLELPFPLLNDYLYEINLNGLATNLSEIAIVYNDKSSRSECIHVNNLGYVPDARMKFGYLSAWLGDGGPLSLDDYSGANFHLVDLVTMQSAFSGQISLRKDLETGDPDNAYTESPYGNFAGADVWECDFSSFNTPGNYVLSVEGIGCSFPFAIDENVYSEAFYMTARVLYHQRSGIELEAQYTDWTRAVDFHPSQGDTVILSDWRYMDGGNAFTELPTYATGQTADYWGGWHDAGDWDRNHNHLGGASALLYVYEFNPPLFSDNELNIPESGNGIPDIIDEAAWTVDFMKRLQSPSGAVRGGLETTNHPREGESSLTETDQWYAYAEEPDASLHYAGVAAQLAFCLEMAGASPALIIDYETSAEAAWVWGINNTTSGEFNQLRDRRQFAAAWLFKLTGDAVYQNRFIADNMITTTTSPLYQWQSHDQKRAVWCYATTNQPNINTNLKNTITSAITNWALSDNVQTAQMRSGRAGYHWWTPTVLGTATTPRNLPLMAAFAVSGDSTFLDYQQTTADFFLGANPLNMTWVTQMGDRHPQEIMHTDSWFYHQDKGMIPGIVPYGPRSFDGMSSNFWQPGYGFANCYPDASQWPSHELWFENQFCATTAEYTVTETICIAAAAYGSLKNNSDANIAPNVTITSPGLDIYSTNGVVSLEANAWDWDGSISKVEYYNESTYLGESTASNYSFDWMPGNDGKYTVTARAIDNEGAASFSAPINVYVGGTVGGIDTDILPKISVYPNPSTDYWVLDMQNIRNEKTEVLLINAFGRKVKTIKPTSTQMEIAIENLTPGFYLLQVESEGKILAKSRVIKTN